METYETNPKGVNAEYGFSIGKHFVEYIAKNEFGDVAKCRYRVEVIGRFNKFFHFSKTVLKKTFFNPNPFLQIYKELINRHVMLAKKMP